ncbi:hypothetical protein WG66_000337 [Moniliophthora roreri]|nr:hypothetical protein WG66_000337 [Moniliophthora roreri]
MSSTSDDDSENFNTGAALMIVGIAIQVGDCSGFLRSIGLAVDGTFNSNDDSLRHTRQRYEKGQGNTEGLPDNVSNAHEGCDGHPKADIHPHAWFDNVPCRLSTRRAQWRMRKHTEWLSNVFDAGLVTVAFYTWNFAHPSLLVDASSTSYSAAAPKA